MDAIIYTRILDEFFVRREDFNLQESANKAFGLYQKDEVFSEIVWRFKPEAAKQAAGFLFHTNQIDEPQDDGSLIICLQASGFLEMARHLYTWSDKVNVLEPAELKTLVKGYQRNDFPAMP